MWQRDYRFGPTGLGNRVEPYWTAEQSDQDLHTDSLCISLRQNNIAQKWSDSKQSLRVRIMQIFTVLCTWNLDILLVILLVQI